MPAIEIRIWQALKARIASLPGGFMINWPREPFTPPVSSGKLRPYIEARHLPNRVNRPFIGSDDPQERPGNPATDASPVCQ